MEKHFVKILVHLNMPNGEAPGVPESNTPTQKIKKALNIVLAPGAEEYGFTPKEMDMDGGDIGLVLTHDEA